MAFKTDFLRGNNTERIHSVFEIDAKKIFIPPGELYDDYEKMFLPFDDGAWIAIGVTVVGTLAAILVMKMFSWRVQGIIFGRNNRSPTMNFISILINGSQHTSLVENSSRLLLMTFMIWSLIIR
jgi:hypothetical protein